MTPAVLAQIHAQAFTQSRPWSETEFADLLDSKGVILLGDVRSFLLGRLIADEAEVLTLATDPTFRRKGHAQSVLGSFLDTMRKQKATSVFLEVAADNTAANSLYKKAIFEIVGTRRNYYSRPDGAKIAAHVMRRSLLIDPATLIR
jgi:ribosomal-protein-alanine N-acetyltransferase